MARSDVGGEPLVTCSYCHTHLSKQVGQSILQVRHCVLESGPAPPQRIALGPEGVKGELERERGGDIILSL